MSIEATFWAWKHRKLKASQKLVLLCLSDNLNNDTKRCDPSIKYISDKTGLDRKTIIQSLAKLEDLSLISQQKRLGTTTNYVLHTNTVFGTSTKKGLTQKRTRTGTKNGHRPVPKTGHKPGTEPGTEPITGVNSLSDNNILATTLDESGWELGEKQLDAIGKHRPELCSNPVAVYHMVEKFKLHFRITGEVKTDWDYVFEMWVIRERV